MRESFAALREREFRLLFTGQLISLLGDSFTSIAGGFISLRVLVRRRRVSAYDWFGSLAFQPLGLAIAGPLAAGIGTSETLWLAAAGSAGIAAILVATPSVRAVTA